jgi:deoxyribodipyrimidine photo-lyase
MRQLKAENRMHGRTRMVVASFLCKDLLIDWRRWEEHFKNYLLDYDTNVNIGNRQWSASTWADPKPLRIFNPILQSAKYDPKWDYIRKRVPELGNRFDKAIHDPIKYTLNEYYPPVVDHYVTSKLAKEMYYKKEPSEGLERLYD